MKHPDPTLATPLYVKTSDDELLPSDENCYHLLTRDGLFLCRNHTFFTSSVPAANFPASLGRHETSCRMRYPKLPRRMFELMIGFFAVIAEKHQSEAGALLAWDSKHKRYRFIIPRQVGTVGCSSYDGTRYPIGLRYTIDRDLPPELIVVGSLHSHVDEAAHSSGVDIDDEKHRPGLHIIVGRINQEPPEVRVQAVIDGVRFRVEPDVVIEGYHRRRMTVPQEWIERVTVEVYKPKPYYASSYDRYDDDDSWRNR